MTKGFKILSSEICMKFANLQWKRKKNHLCNKVGYFAIKSATRSLINEAGRMFDYSPSLHPPAPICQSTWDARGCFFSTRSFFFVAARASPFLVCCFFPSKPSAIKKGKKIRSFSVEEKKGAKTANENILNN